MQWALHFLVRYHTRKRVILGEETGILVTHSDRLISAVLNPERSYFSQADLARQLQELTKSYRSATSDRTWN
jgi:hypothetical protein